MPNFVALHKMCVQAQKRCIEMGTDIGREEVPVFICALLQKAECE